jgi:hypothetical protein
MAEALGLTLSCEIREYNDFNIYVKCQGFIIGQIIFFNESKYLTYLENIKKNISKMKRGVSMDVKRGLVIDNIVFKYLSSQKMIKKEDEEIYNDDDEGNKGTFEISINNIENNFFHITIPFNQSIIEVFENLVKWIEESSE